MKRSAILPFLLFGLFCGTRLFSAETVPLSSLDLAKMSAGWGKPLANKAVQGKPMSIGGQGFEHGVGTHAPSVMYVDLGGGTEKFSALVGVDDEVKGRGGSVRFHVYGDGKELWKSGVMKSGEPAKKAEVDVKGIKWLVLSVNDGGDGIACDHADWAEAKFEVAGARPKSGYGPREEPVILTPKPSPRPRINGPKVFGLRPAIRCSSPSRQRGIARWSLQPITCREDFRSIPGQASSPDPCRSGASTW